jgi:hypothetical protein
VEGLGCHLTLEGGTGCFPSRTLHYKTDYCRLGLFPLLAAMCSALATVSSRFVHTCVKRATGRWPWEQAGGRRSLP